MARKGVEEDVEDVEDAIFLLLRDAFARDDADFSHHVAIQLICRCFDCNDIRALAARTTEL